MFLAIVKVRYNNWSFAPGRFSVDVLEHWVPRYTMLQSFISIREFVFYDMDMSSKDMHHTWFIWSNQHDVFHMMDQIFYGTMGWWSPQAKLGEQKVDIVHWSEHSRIFLFITHENELFLSNHTLKMCREKGYLSKLSCEPGASCVEFPQQETKTEETAVTTLTTCLSFVLWGQSTSCISQWGSVNGQAV